MLFASLPFLLVFLPLVLAGAYATRRWVGVRSALAFLSLASIVFYGWSNPANLVVLVGSLAANYLIGDALARKPDRWLLAAGITLNLGLLAWFKYSGFIAFNLSALTGGDFDVGEVLLPLGISFFTFQKIAYLVDIHTGKIGARSLLDYVFFIVFFPQLIAGPIVHHKQLIPQLGNEGFAKMRSDDLSAGVLQFSIGLAKKVLIADQLRFASDRLFETAGMGVGIGAAEAWIGMLCYAFQIYFDFSGYSDMALGLGRMFGLRLPENFASPYKSASIIDFWRRWNITLSHFLRDYLYVALGGNRHGELRRSLNLWAVMLLGGLWHGANWTFVVWGGLHGAYLTINHMWRRHGGPDLPAPLGIAITFLAVLVAWVFFRAATFEDAFSVLTAMAGLGGGPAFSLDIYANIAPTLAPPWLLLPLAGLIVWAAPNSTEITAWFDKPESAARWRMRLAGASGALAALAGFNLFAAGSYAFIYFQF